MSSYLDWNNSMPKQYKASDFNFGMPNTAPELYGSAAPAASPWSAGFGQATGNGGIPSLGAAPVFDSRSFMDSMMGGKNKDGTSYNGWGGAALGAAGGLMNGFMAMKQYGLSKDILANNKAQFAANFAAQKGITNSGLSDRQDRRNREASANGNPSSAMSSAEYMSKYGVA